MPRIEQWWEMWKGLGATSADAGLFSQLIERYSERHRHYHTVQHLDECFAWLPKTRPLAQHPHEIELALWFHDAIYDVKRQDNEPKSAEWGKAAALRSGVSAATAERVYDLVMVTRHRAQPEGTDARILVDIDLSILGAPNERFDEYERVVGFDVHDLLDVQAALASMAKSRPDVLHLVQTSVTTGIREQIGALTMQARVPLISAERTMAEAGAVLTYGRKLEPVLKRGATYVDRILKGASIRDLPIEQPTEFELVVN